jgi:hypothetical protein
MTNQGEQPDQIDQAVAAAGQVRGVVTEVMLTRPNGDQCKVGFVVPEDLQPGDILAISESLNRHLRAVLAMADAKRGPGLLLARGALPKN